MKHKDSNERSPPSRDKAINRTDTEMTQMLELPQGAFKITMIYILKALVEHL